jgi:hypothetical protein
MPTIEKDVQYEFPRTDHERAFFIDFHSAHDRMWISTSLKEGRMRMKFAHLECVREDKAGVPA